MPVPARHARLAELLRTVLPQLGEVYTDIHMRLDDAAWVGHRLAEILPMPLADKQNLSGDRRPHSALGRLAARPPPLRIGHPGTSRRPQRRDRWRRPRAAASSPANHRTARPTRNTAAPRRGWCSSAAFAAPPPSRRAVRSPPRYCRSARASGSSRRPTASQAKNESITRRGMTQRARTSAPADRSRCRSPTARAGCWPWRKNAGSRTAAP